MQPAPTDWVQGLLRQLDPEYKSPLTAEWLALTKKWQPAFNVKLARQLEGLAVGQVAEHSPQWVPPLARFMPQPARAVHHLVTHLRSVNFQMWPNDVVHTLDWEHRFEYIQNQQGELCREFALQPLPQPRDDPVALEWIHQGIEAHKCVWPDLWWLVNAAQGTLFPPGRLVFLYLVNLLAFHWQPSNTFEIILGNFYLAALLAAAVNRKRFSVFIFYVAQRHTPLQDLYLQLVRGSSQVKAYRYMFLVADTIQGEHKFVSLRQHANRDAMSRLIVHWTQVLTRHWFKCRTRWLTDPFLTPEVLETVFNYCMHLQPSDPNPRWPIWLPLPYAELLTEMQTELDDLKDKPEWYNFPPLPSAKIVILAMSVVWLFRLYLQQVEKEIAPDAQELAAIVNEKFHSCWKRFELKNRVEWADRIAFYRSKKVFL